MSTLRSIPPEMFTARAHDLWANQWMLLTSGDLATGRFNAMTVGWGSIGTMWGRPFVQVVVRPTRYTYTFMERYDTFTLCAFPARFRDALLLLGQKSGRDGDKIAASGLKPVPASRVPAPAYAEADLVLECRTIYSDDIDPAHFIDGAIESNYPARDYHRIYFGEIVVALGTAAYGAPPAPPAP